MPRTKGSLNKKTLEKLGQNTSTIEQGKPVAQTATQTPEPIKKQDNLKKQESLSNKQKPKKFTSYQGKRSILRSVKLNVDGPLNDEGSDNSDSNDIDDGTSNIWRIKVLDKEYNTTEKVKAPECFIVVLIAPDNTIPKVLSLHEYEEGELYTGLMFKDKSTSNPHGMTKNDLCKLVDFEKEVRPYNQRNTRIDNRSVDTLIYRDWETDRKSTRLNSSH